MLAMNEEGARMARFEAENKRIVKNQKRMLVFGGSLLV